MIDFLLRSKYGLWSVGVALYLFNSFSQEDIVSSFADRKPLYLSLFGCSGINFETSISELQGQKGNPFLLVVRWWKFQN